MAKELPYFQFEVNEWLNDRISLEDYKTKGLFIDVCAWYWFMNCQVTLAMLKRRFSDAQAELEALLNPGLINAKNEGENISIKFLDDQFEKLTNRREKIIEAGRAGGLKRASNAQAMLKQPSSNIEIEIETEIDINIPFSDFWNLYSRKIGNKKSCEKKWNKLRDSEREKIMETLPSFLVGIKDKQFQPYPETYLNQRRWEDETAEPQQSNPHGKRNGNLITIPNTMVY